MAKIESLGTYVSRIMQEKHLTNIDVQERSGRQIADSYISNITKNKADNPSVKKLQALARGLGADEDEIFRVARGLPIRSDAKKENDPWPANVLLRIMGKIVSSPELTRIIKTIVKMKPQELKDLLNHLEGKRS